MDVKDYKRVSNGSEYRDVLEVGVNEPRYRSNGHKLAFDSNNSDYVSLPFSLVNIGDSFEIIVSVDNSIGTQSLCTQDGGEDNNIVILSNGQILLRTKNNTNNISSGDNVINPNSDYKIKAEKNSSNKINLFVDDVLIGETPSETDFRTDTIMKRGGAYASGRVKFIEINGETFNPTNIDNSYQIEGSLGTIAQVQTSSADSDYILTNMLQKSSFALVGNGTTQKIIGHLGTEIILNSTPLTGGFTLDGVIYNLYEGLGNELTSETGEKASIQGFTGTDLNFGGWLKGNILDGWNPYLLS